MPLVVTGNSDVQQRPVITIGHTNPVDGFHIKIQVDFSANQLNLYPKQVKQLPKL